MAEDTVVKDSLTEDMIRFGEDLIKKLDQVQWPVFAAFWLYLPELNSWKLVLASPIVALKGPREAYQAIQMALAVVPQTRVPITLSDVEVVEPNHYLVILFRSALETGPIIGSIRFTGNVINGQFVHDAYIYRVSDRPPGNSTE